MKETAYWMPWKEQFSSRFLSAQRGVSLEAHVDVVCTQSPPEYGVRVMSADAGCPKESEIEIVPS